MSNRKGCGPPKAKAQRNFTDPDSRIINDGATKEFVQAYNAQAVVDSKAQLIVAAEVTQEENDKKQLVPMLEQVIALMESKPQQAMADAGYFTEASVTADRLEGTDLFVAPDKQKHSDEVTAATGPPPPESSSVTERMRYKLRTPEGQTVYKRRKVIVEPVFGQIKEAPGFRRFCCEGWGRCWQNGS